jgi:ABC-type microcin C transport system permease subunit YejB
LAVLRFPLRGLTSSNWEKNHMGRASWTISGITLPVIAGVLSVCGHHHADQNAFREDPQAIRDDRARQGLSERQVMKRVS